MSGFQHDIAGGSGNLIITALQSPNFVDSVSGWQIAKDGSAEFNNLEIRGTFNGQDFILNANGFFFYNGTPGAGNLAMAITNASGYDEFGNPYSGPGIALSWSGDDNEIQIRPDLNAILLYQ